MQKLFWNKKGKIIATTETAFQTEDELERFILGAKEILSDIFILKRQVRAGRDIPDMVGVDQENCAVIIENKNVAVDEEIIPQIMRYAVWAETHQDTIRAWWLEVDDRPDDLQIDWDRLQIRLIVLAPSIKATVPRLVGKLGYPVHLFEIKKFVVGRDEIISVNQIELPRDEGGAMAKGLQVYDREFFKERRNPRSVEAFFRVINDLDTVVKNEGWKLEKKLNSSYAGFKLGFFNVFGVSWLGTKSFEIFIHLPKNKIRKAKQLCPYPAYQYDKGLSLTFADNIKPRQLTRLLQFAYDSFMGEHPTD